MVANDSVYTAKNKYFLMLAIISIKYLIFSPDAFFMDFIYSYCTENDCRSLNLNNNLSQRILIIIRKTAIQKVSTIQHDIQKRENISSKIIFSLTL